MNELKAMRPKSGRRKIASLRRKCLESFDCEGSLKFETRFEIASPDDLRRDVANLGERQPDHRPEPKLRIGLKPCAVRRKIGDLAQRAIKTATPDPRVQRDRRAWAAPAAQALGRFIFRCKRSRFVIEVHAARLARHS